MRARSSFLSLPLRACYSESGLRSAQPPPGGGPIHGGLTTAIGPQGAASSMSERLSISV